jgi:dephospho-CoA kinase
MRPLIIALCGFKRCGKDTAAQYLESHHAFHHIKISAALKRMIKGSFQFTDEQIESDEKDSIDQRWGVTPRQVMQFMGTEVMQFKIQELLPSVGRNFWMMHLMHEINNCEQNDTCFVISDLRFLHEVEYLRSSVQNKDSVVVVRIENKKAQDQALKDDHVSEKEHLQFDINHVIDNNGTKEELFGSLDAVLNQMNQSNCILR